MRISSKKLQQAMKRADTTPEQLASAVARPGLSEKTALKAVQNWLRGRDYPKAGAADIRAMAEALSVEVKGIARFESVSFGIRTSARKARLIADLIRNRRVLEAENLLRFNKRRAAWMLHKTLRSALAEAEQHGVDQERLFITECRVDGGMIVKRFQPKDRGRAHAIQKRTSHLVVSLEEVA